MRRAVFIVAMLGGCTPVTDVLDVDVEVDVAASDDGEHDAPSTIRPIDDLSLIHISEPTRPY